MTTHRKRFEFYTETKRVVVVDGKPVVKQVTCCCAAPAATRKGCSTVAGNKSPCGCFCHSMETSEQWRERRAKK